MKYSEFEQLNSILENKGTNLDSFVKTTIGKKLFEAGDPNELDTKNGNILTRAGRARMKLNTNAKKVQTEIMKNLYDKYYGPVLENKKKIMAQVIKLKEDNQTLEEIKTQLGGNLQTALNAQRSQMLVLDKAIDKMLMNYTKKIDAVIQKSKMTDNNKLSLSNYWVMLTSQLKLNLYKYIQQQELKFVDSSLTAAGVNDENEQNEIEAMMGSGGLDEKVKTQTATVTQAKQTAKEAMAKETNDEAPAEEAPKEEAPAEEAPAEEAPAEEAPAEEAPKEEAPAEETEVPKGESEEIQSVEAEEVAGTEQTPGDQAEVQEVIVNGKPIAIGKEYTYEFNGKEHTLKINKIEDKGVTVTKDGKEQIIASPKELQQKNLAQKALPAPAAPKRVIKTEAPASTSGNTIVAPEKTDSTIKAEKKAGPKKKAEVAPTEEKPAATAPVEEKPAETSIVDAKGKAMEAGARYNYTNAKGEVEKVKVISVDASGVRIKKDSDPKTVFILSKKTLEKTPLKKLVSKKKTDEEKASTKAPATGNIKTKPKQ